MAAREKNRKVCQARTGENELLEKVMRKSSTTQKNLKQFSFSDRACVCWVVYLLPSVLFSNNFSDTTCVCWFARSNKITT